MVALKFNIYLSIYLSISIYIHINVMLLLFACLNIFANQSPLKTLEETDDVKLKVTNSSNYQLLKLQFIID